MCLIRHERAGRDRAARRRRCATLLWALLLCWGCPPAASDADGGPAASKDRAAEAPDAAPADAATDGATGRDAVDDLSSDRGADDASTQVTDASTDAGADTGADVQVLDPCRGLTLCTEAGWSCDGDVAVSCLENEQGCLVETHTDCTLLPGGYCSTAGVLDGCRQDDDPCGGIGSCPATTYCEGEVLHTCLSDAQGCATTRASQDCTREAKRCVELEGEAQCVADRAASSAQIRAVREAIDGASSLPLSGDWTIDNAWVSYVKPPLGADPGGFFLQAEREGPAIFVVHDDPVGVVEVGDEVSIWFDEVDREQGRRLVTGLGWLDIYAQGYDPSPWVQDVSAVDLVAELEDYEHELVSLSATVTGPFSGAGSGFVDAVIATQGVTSGEDLRLRLPTALSTQLLGGRTSLVGCALQVEAVPVWRYLERAQPSAHAMDELSLSCP